jgi:superfamily II DNA/RNA helicase
VPFDAKFDLVASIAAREGRTLCFVRTKHGADRLARNLGRSGIAAGVLHGGRTQGQRTKALDSFKDGSVSVLVATDVAARGIHVDGVSLVLHVDPPADPKDYLHRSGRTARAGESGTVVLLTTPGEERDVRSMLTKAGVRAEQLDAVAGDPVVARTTGARRPSGVAVARPVSPTQQRNRRGARPDAGRPGRTGSRRPRRPRS